MNPEIHQTHTTLLQLDVIDLELDALTAEARRVPAEIKEEYGAIAALDEARAAAAVELAATEKAQKESERALEAIEKRKARAEARLPSLGTMGQIEATQREIAALSAEGGDIETTILELMDSVETQEAAIAEQDGTLERARALLTEHEAAWAERKPNLKARHVELTAEREPLEGSLRSDVVRRYQLGRNQSQWKIRTGVTWVNRARVCRTCRTSVSARWIQECREHTAMHACDSCKRMLVPQPTPDEDAAEEA